MGKIQVGYGSGSRGSTKKNLYGGRSSGKKLINGGFNGAITLDYTRVKQEDWDRIFPPKDKKES